MAVFKCKMCGGDLNLDLVQDNVVECEYCSTKQTIPSTDNEKLANLYNRANRLRFSNEFDKAAGVFESIAAEFPEEAEAYWGICLCKYGIEYVDDPATARKIPTCHRTSFKSIFDDENYKIALENADVVAQKVYRDEARAIDTLQKDILSVVNSAEPYDVFICYKETGDNKYGQCNISDWRDIVAIYAGYLHSLGLKSDGTVVAEGCSEEDKAAISEWKDIRTTPYKLDLSQKK